MADLRFARIWVPVFLPVTFSFLFLHLVLGLDVSVAPVWQVLLSHALGAAFALLFYAVSVHLFFPRWSGWRWIAAVVGALFLMAVLLLGWWQGGAYWGLRGAPVGGSVGDIRPGFVPGAFAAEFLPLSVVPLGTPGGISRLTATSS